MGIIGICVAPVSPAFPQGVIGRTYADRGRAEVVAEGYDQFATPPYLGLCPESGLAYCKLQGIVYGLPYFDVRAFQPGYVFKNDLHDRIGYLLRRDSAIRRLKLFFNTSARSDL